MSKSNRPNTPSIRKNYIYRLAYEVLIIFTPFITTPYVARIFGVDGNGIYSWTYSIVTYFVLAANLGTASYGSREIAQHRDDQEAASKLFWEIELMTVMTSAICLVVWCGVITFGGGYKFYFLAHTPFIIAAMLDISWFFTGYERVKYIVLRNSICKITGIVLLFVLVHKKRDLIIYILINAFVQMLGNLSMWTYLPRMLTKVDFKGLRFVHHFRETLVYFIPTIATSVYTVLDKTLIGAITRDAYQNGYYEQATKITNILKSLVFTSVNAVMGARMAYLFAEEKIDEIHRRIRRSMDFIFLLGFGCVFGVISVARRFVPFFFGKGYEPVIPLLYIMTPIVLIIGVSNCLGSHYYTPSGRRRQSTKYIIIGSCVNLVLNLLMIPHLGANGATIASIIAELSISALYLRSCNGYMTVSLLVKLGWRRVLSGVGMLFCLILLDHFLSFKNSICIVVMVVLGAAIYGGLLLLMRDELTWEFLGTGRRILTKIIKR